MPETLNRANTIWPRASAGPLHSNPANDADDQRDPTCVTQPSTSSSEIHHKRQKHRLVKKPASQQESPLSSRDENRPIDDVPVPPSLRATEIVGVVSGNRPHTGGLIPGNKIYNQHMVPTARALNQSIVITPICVWELYEAIELCDNQGTCPDRNSSVICRRKTSSDAQDCLFVVKEQRWSGGAIPRHVVKPRSPYIVDLHSAFFQDGTVWTIYEEMDLSLEQIFELDCDPWTVDPGRKDLQISAISAQVGFSTTRFAHSLITQQVLRGLVYIHDNLGVARGAISARNVLLKRTGRVKLGEHSFDNYL